METVSEFIFLGSKITADGDCSHQIKRHLLLGKKVMTNLDIILKNRDIALPTKVRLVKAMVFPVVMYRCESWTVRKAEHWKTDAFELWCWGRPLRVPWTIRRSNQSILKEISPGFSLKYWCWSWNSNTLATSREELTHWKRLWCWDRLGAGGEEDASLNWQRESEWTPGVGDGQGGLACCDSWGRRVRHDWATYWTDLNWWTPYLWQRRQEIYNEKGQFL